jgi:hypothetical protein
MLYPESGLPGPVEPPLEQPLEQPLVDSNSPSDPIYTNRPSTAVAPSSDPVGTRKDSHDAEDPSSASPALGSFSSPLKAGMFEELAWHRYRTWTLSPTKK